MLDDLWKSVKASLYDRTASPLFGAVAISWVFWNYRLLVLLFADMPVSEKFNFIDSVLYPEGWTKLVWLGVGPSVTALLFLLAYPFPARWIYGYWHNQQKALKAVRQAIEDDTPLTREESRQLRRRLVELRAEYDSQLQQTNAESDELRSILADTRELLAKSREESEKLREHALSPSERLQRADILNSPINEKALVEYEQWRFPEKPHSPRVATMLIKDLDSGRYRTIRDLDDAVSRAQLAVEAYASEAPEVFEYSTDHLTKSLGFVDEDFRSAHGFSSNTRAALGRYADLVAE